MARKLNKTDAPAPDDTASDAEVLHPERTVTLAGREITVCEYEFFDSFEVYVIAEPLIADLTNALALERSAAWPLIVGALARHRDVVLELIRRATAVEPEWLHRLSDVDGQLLLMLWWGVNGPFFVRRAVTALAVQARMAAESAGPNSSPPSPATDTTPSDSATTPPGG